MGRETACEAWHGDLHGRVVAHLDGQALQLRGAIRATLPLASLQQVRADGDGLHAVTPAGPLRLAMGIRDAAAWRERILAPPSLAKKLSGVCALSLSTRPPVQAYRRTSRMAIAAVVSAMIASHGSSPRV